MVNRLRPICVGSRSLPITGFMGRFYTVEYTGTASFYVVQDRRAEKLYWGRAIG